MTAFDCGSCASCPTHARFSTIGVSSLRIETSPCHTNRQMTLMDTPNSGSLDDLESARPCATRADDVCVLLNEWRPFAAPAFEEQHGALVEYVTESCSIDATQILWSEVARLAAGAGVKPGKRSILHRHSYVVLDRAPPLSEKKSASTSCAANIYSSSRRHGATCAPDRSTCPVPAHFVSLRPAEYGVAILRRRRSC